MSEKLLKVGCRVLVPKKGVKGVIAYIGNTAFSQGKWVGINLDEPKGKNNGSVENKLYFTCEENHGMFVRQTQLILLDDNDCQVADLTDEGNVPKTPRSTTTRLSSNKKKASPVTSQPTGIIRLDQSNSRLSLASVASSASKEDLSGSTTSLSTPMSASATKRTSSFLEKTPKSTKNIPVKASSKTPAPTGKSGNASKSRSQSRDDISESQTGFVETVKPQFVPGQVMLSPSPALSGSTTAINILGGANNVSLLQQQIEILKGELKDSHEKYETIIVKRRQDKEKLKELEQARVQLDQLTEFKSRILESKAALQRELQQARKEANDAVDARNAHAEEMADLAETVEMATLDKEMAEEKAESLVQELQELKDKLEEVTLDYETLKAELESSATLTGEPRERVSFEYKQLEQQNARLQETLLKMRDVVAQGRHEYQKLMKDVDQKKSEIAELSRTKEKLSSRVEQLEEQVVDLQEQVDAAVGAETMASTLTYDKMMLQEEVEKLREEITDMEAIECANEQLLEEQKEIEVELNERLDLTFGRLREAQREKEAALENLADREQTIHKYREVVSALQQERSDLLNRLELATNRPVAVPESLDYNKVFSDTIAHKRAIDLELRQIDLKQKEQHVNFLTAFMPDCFMGRGGDHDAILMLLLLPRMLLKCDILLSYIRDKFPSVDKIHRTAVIRDDSFIRFSFGARMAYHLNYLQMVLHQYLHGMNTCGAEMLPLAGSRYPELAIQERTIDSYIVSVKEDRLDENVLTEPLEKCCQVIEATRAGALPDASHHASYYVRDACAALTAASEAATTDALAIQALANLEKAGANNPVILMTQYLALNLNVCGQQLRNIRRRIPGKEPSLNIPSGIITELVSSVITMGKVVRTLNHVHKQARQAVLLQGEPDASVAVEKVEEDFNVAADRHLDSDDSGVDTVKAAVAALTAVVGKLNDLVEKHDYDLIIPEEAPQILPISKRAAAVKMEIDQVKVLAKKLEDRELDIKELKKTLKLKGDELSEMTIRKDLLEKKLSNINKDYDYDNTKLKNDLKDLQEELKKKTKEFEETMDHLQADIDNLEAEKKELKERERLNSKKLETCVKGDISIDKATSPTGASNLFVENGSVAPAEVYRLRNLLNEESHARYKLECKIEALRIQEALNKIPSLEVKSKETEVLDKKVEELENEGAQLRKEIIASNVIKIPDFSKLKPGEDFDATKYLRNHAHQKEQLRVKINDFKSKVANLTAQNNKGGVVRTALTCFATPQMAAAVQETKPVTVATLRIPVPPESDYAGRNIPLVLHPHQIDYLLHKISNPFP